MFFKCKHSFGSKRVSSQTFSVRHLFISKGYANVKEQFFINRKNKTKQQKQNKK